MKKLILATTAMLTLLVSCQKEVNEKKITTNEPEPKVLVRTNLIGDVYDDKGNPVSNINVSAYDSQTSTSLNGRFSFENILIEKGETNVLTEVSGFFPGIGAVNTSSNGRNYTEINLLAKPDAKTINPNMDAEVSFPGLNIAVSENILRKEDGNSVIGNASVSAKHMDPLSEAFKKEIPGQLLVLSVEGEMNVIDPLGMMALELESEEGENLMTEEGEEIVIELEVDDEVLLRGPSEIDLYIYDLDEQRWIPNARCQKTSTGYTFGVSHGGYYCFGFSLPSICFMGTAYNADSTAGSFLKVVIEDLADNHVYYGFANEDGEFCGAVPKAADLRFSIIDHCDNLLYTEDLGPYDVDFDLGDIYLTDVVEEFVVNIMANPFDCLGEEQDLGHFAVRIPGQLRVIPYFASEIDVNLGLNCLNFPEMDVTVHQFNSDQTNLVTSFDQLQDVVLGDVTMCESAEDYFKFNYDGEDFVASPTEYFTEPNQSSLTYVLKAYATGTIYTIVIRNYIGEGTYTSNVFINTKIETQTTMPYMKASSPSVELVINSTDNDQLVGTINGTVKDFFGTDIPLNGSFVFAKAP